MRVRTFFRTLDSRFRGNVLFLLAVVAAVIFSLAAMLEHKINSSNRSIKTLEQKAFALDAETRTLETELGGLTTVERVRSRADKYLPHYKTMTKDDVYKRGSYGPY